MTLTPFALENAALLRRLQVQDFPSKTALATELGRDQSNFSKTLKRLEAEGLLAGTALTDAGANAVRILDQLAASPTEGTGLALTNGAVAEIELALIDTDPLLNPRTVFAEAPLQALADSIRDKGVAQPILLRPGLEAGRYRVVAGERRTRASRLAGLERIPAIIRGLDDDQALEIATIENIQREDLSALEEAVAFKRIVDAKLRLHPDLSLKDAKEIIAEAVRKTVRYVEHRMDLLELPEALQKRVATPKDEPGHMKLEDARLEVQRIRRAKREAEERLLDPADLLIMAELVAKCDREPSTPKNYWYGPKPTEVDWDVEGDLKFDALVKRGFIKFNPDLNFDGRAHAGLGPYGFSKKDVVDQLPGFGGAKRAAALHGLRIRVLGEARADEIKAGGHYATWWLNGPFKPDPRFADDIARREKKAQEESSRAEKALARNLQARDTADAVVRELAARPPAAALRGFTEVFALIDRPTPWRMDPRGNVYAANGKTIVNDHYYGEPDPAIQAQRMLLVAAVNLAAGAAFTVEPEAPAAEAADA